ncbi:hypothetical protein [Mesorhizobium sp. STM 4661]|uniref:hypothetical protein n=1 Tax=Mesorhizobium sp. STM 4661 TaxID=1297570 RepID=UPI0002BD9271|nr:hypothetical protein [Mesorhizobium sp. STM 4661]CCV11936.1 hypothetical protein MESS4_360038 [Mesorhizobium sp. STM 4661]
MSGHKRSYRSGREDHRRDEYSERRFTDVPVAGRPAPRTLRPVAWIAVLIGLLIWSAAAWIGYVTVDSLLGWAAANAGIAIDSGKNLATGIGVGKEQVGAVDALNVSGLLGQAIALLRVVAKPAIVILWVIGALALLTAPLILSRIGRLLAARRH